MIDDQTLDIRTRALREAMTLHTYPGCNAPSSPERVLETAKMMERYLISGGERPKEPHDGRLTKGDKVARANKDDPMARSFLGYVSDTFDEGRLAWVNECIFPTASLRRLD